MTNRTGLAVLAGACIGAGLMYLADPDLGRRRRALIGDQVTSANRKLGRFMLGTRPLRTGSAPKMKTIGIGDARTWSDSSSIEG